MQLTFSGGVIEVVEHLIGKKIENIGDTYIFNLNY